MMRKLVNNTASPVTIDDTGDTVPASGFLIINPLYYGKYEGSADVLGYLTDQAISPTVSTLTANDGTFNLDISTGVRLIQGGYNRPIADGLDPQILARVTALGVLVTDPIELGTPAPYDGVIASTPNVEQTLVDFTVGAGVTTIMSKIKVSAFWSGSWVALADSAIIGSGIVSAGKLESTYSFKPRKILHETVHFELKFLSSIGPVTDVFYHVQTSEI